MARWKLLQPHYLNVPGTEWEYTENDRKTNKPKRFRFPTPLHLNPIDPADWNAGDKDDGYIAVANRQSNEFPNDIIFEGDPTPDMQPLDDEARELSAKFASKWKHPIEELPAQGGFSATLLTTFQDEVANAMTKSTEAAAAQMGEAMASMAAIMKQNQELIALLVAKSAPEARKV